MTLRLTGMIIEKPRRRAQQMVAPWGSYCCAEAARVRGVSWGWMARRMRAAGMVNRDGGLRHIRITVNQLERI